MPLPVPTGAGLPSWTGNCKTPTSTAVVVTIGRGSRWPGRADSQICQFGVALTTSRQTETGARNGGDARRPDVLGQ
jgi:hypothetical protein